MKFKAQRLFQRGTAAFRNQAADKAEAWFAEAVADDPQAAEAWFWLGLVRAAQGKLPAAAEALAQARTLDPRQPDHHYNFGLARQLLGEQAEAATAYEQAAALRPGHAATWHNLAAACEHLGRHEQAIEAYEKLLALEIPPDERREAESRRYALGLGLLDQGRWTPAAWKGYRARWRLLPEGFQAPRLPFPEWDGRIIPGYRLFLWPEQGFGDNLMMFRYAAWLARQGMAVSWFVPPALRPLFQRQESGVEVLGEIDPQRPFDGHQPIMGLLEALRVSSEMILPLAPCLRARPEPRPATLQAGKLQVGLAWAGNPNHPNDQHRSLPGLQALGPLLQIPGLQFHALQPGFGTEELQAAGINNPAREFRSFDDTAAFVQHLDLVVSVDTAAAHLAAALGKPVWILLPKPTEWRWYPYAETTPWYPSARLFIQKQSGDWDEVLRRVAQELAMDGRLKQ